MVMKGPNSERKTRVAIIGGGPSGQTLAILLKKKGADVTVFTQGKRPALIVGESLVPAIIPVFRRLGIEEEVAAVSQHKPGVTIRFGKEDEINLSFQLVNGVVPTYAYNVPRPEFDEILDRRSLEAGVRRVETRVKLQKGTSADREVELDEATRNLVPNGKGLILI